MVRRKQKERKFTFKNPLASIATRIIVKPQRIVKARPARMVFYAGGESEELDTMDYGDKKRKLVTMTPKEFLQSTRIQQRYHNKVPPYREYKESLETTDTGSTLDDEGESVPSPQLIDTLATKIEDENTSIDTPYLRLNRGLPVAHEGRHRAIAAERVGMKKIPVVLLHDEDDEVSRDVHGYHDIEQIFRQRDSRSADRILGRKKKKSSIP
ncbi:MAG: hypothetical protein WC525_09750 [Candidatus Thermoplasmatota archaeon]